MIYILIAVALFAALNFLLSRQDTSGQGTLTEEKLEIDAGQIIQVAVQVKLSVDTLLYSGIIDSDKNGYYLDELDFTTPYDEPAFSTAPHLNKIFHPEGGSTIMPRIPPDSVKQINTNPKAGWYMGRFNNVEWTQSTNQDVILLAHQLSKEVCERINEKLTGSITIPALTLDINKILIDSSLHSGGANADLDTTVCAACEGYPALCVKNNAGTIYSFYNVIEQE